MRKLLLILLMIPLMVCSQEGYKPLLREGRAWKHVFSSVARSYERVLTVGGDTLIGGLRWKKVYNTYGVDPSGVAQDNTLSMLVDGRNWRYEHLEPDGNGRPIDGAGEGYITYQYVLKVDGDTIFDGRPCKKINWDGPKDIYWEVSEVTTPYAYGYEEDGKVMLYALYTLYAFYPAFPEKQWVTLYDFNVQKDGLCNMAAFWRKGMIVREDGMVDKDGTVRRYIGLGYDNSSTSIVYAVEGIGSSFGLFEFINLITDGSNSRFIGCYDGETCLYSADDFNSLSTDIRSIQAAKRSQPSGMYNLQGQQLSKTPQHGLYIQNGKKICR